MYLFATTGFEHRSKLDFHSPFFCVVVHDLFHAVPVLEHEIRADHGAGSSLARLAVDGGHPPADAAAKPLVHIVAELEHLAESWRVVVRHGDGVAHSGEEVRAVLVLRLAAKVVDLGDGKGNATGYVCMYACNGLPLHHDH